MATLRNLGILKCDHHQCETTSFLAGIDDVSRCSGREDVISWNDTGTTCLLCGASLKDGDWCDGSIDFDMDTGKVSMDLLAIRLFSDLVCQAFGVPMAWFDKET